MTNLVGGIDLDLDQGQVGQVRLDWKEYFMNFIEEHGEPINFEGRLLFRDGWGYSATKYEGPEFKPPEDYDEFRRLQLQYWTVQREKVSREYKQLQDQIKALEDWQDRMSLPLQQRRVYKSENENVLRLSKPENMDLLGLKHKLLDLLFLWREATEHWRELS